MAAPRFCVLRSEWCQKWCQIVSAATPILMSLAAPRAWPGPPCGSLGSTPIRKGLVEQIAPQQPAPKSAHSIRSILILTATSALSVLLQSTIVQSADSSIPSDTTTALMTRFDLILFLPVIGAFMGGMFHPHSCLCAGLRNRFSCIHGALWFNTAATNCSAATERPVRCARNL